MCDVTDLFVQAGIEEGKKIGKKRGKKIGKKIGKKAGKMEVARNMAAMGMPFDQIVLAVGEKAVVVNNWLKKM